jgi:hypothetical protein
MKKKVSKKKKPVKSKIDIVIESLVNLEQRTKELIDKVKDLHTQTYYHPKNAEPKKYWPNVKWNPPEYN